MAEIEAVKLLVSVKNTRLPSMGNRVKIWAFVAAWQRYRDLSLVGNGSQVALLEVARAVGVEQLLEILDLGLQLNTDVSILHMHAMVGEFHQAAPGFDVLTQSHGLVD